MRSVLLSGALDKRDNKSLGVVFYYIKLNPIIVGSYLVILDLDLVYNRLKHCFINGLCYTEYAGFENTAESAVALRT